MSTVPLHDEPAGITMPLDGTPFPGSVATSAVVYDFGVNRSTTFMVDVEMTQTVQAGLGNVGLFAAGIQMENDPAFPVGVTDTAQSLLIPLPADFTASPETRRFSLSNENWMVTPGTRRYARAFFVGYELGFGGGGIFEVFQGKITLFDGIDLVIQAAPTPTPGANVYASIPDLLALMATWSCIPATFFPLLSPGRQEAIWIGATRRIETEVRSLCPPQPSGSAPVNPDTQRLVWPRRGAHGLDGLLITSWLSSWVEGIAHYAEEMARAEIDGVAVDEPGETQGMTSIQLGPEDADFRGQWGSDGKSGSFFAAPGRAKIWNLLSESFQSRSRG